MVIVLRRQREAERFRARQPFHSTQSISKAPAAETSSIGTRTTSLCKREAFIAAATAPRPTKSLADAMATKTAHAPSTILPTKAAPESKKDGEESCWTFSTGELRTVSVAGILFFLFLTVVI